jgi:putative transcriptional regulator
MNSSSIAERPVQHQAVHHHPDAEMILAHAGGSLSGGVALVVATHVEGCAHCQRQVSEFEVLGGAMLESIEPDTMRPDALAQTLARIDGGSRNSSTNTSRLTSELASAEVASTSSSSRSSASKSAADVPRSLIRAQLPNGTPWPLSMRGCAITRWRWIGPGMRWSRVTLPHDPSANVFLLRIAAGKSLPPHTHSEVELTQVLYGTFHDGRALFGPGDFDAADTDIHHQPVVQPGGECVCLASVTGKVMFDGAIARMLGSLVGM